VIAIDHIEQVYREQGDRLYHALLAYSGSSDVAREAVAEALARALASAEAIRDVVPWVWRVAFRLAAHDLRQRRRFAPATEMAAWEMPEPHDLFASLAQLSERQRACIVLHYHAGYTLDEIAAILGTRKATVGVHLHRGRNRLHQLLEVQDA